MESLFCISGTLLTLQKSSYRNHFQAVLSRFNKPWQAVNRDAF